MNHQPFEDWLFADKTLSPGDQQKLADHLNTCVSCQEISNAWEQVEHDLRSAAMLEPEEGFVQRWQVRLVNDNTKRQRRQSWSFLGFYLVGSISLLFILGLFTLPLIKSPLLVLIMMALRITNLLSTLDIVLEFVNTLFRTIYQLIPASLWIGIGTALAALSALWIVALNKLTTVRRNVI